MKPTNPISSAAVIATRIDINGRIADLREQLQAIDKQFQTLSNRKEGELAQIENLENRLSNAEGTEEHRVRTAAVAQIDTELSGLTSAAEKIENQIAKLQLELQSTPVSTDQLRELLQSCIAANVRGSELQSLLEKSKSKLQSQIASADLRSDKDLDELTRLQTRVAVLPSQIELCEAESARLETGLLDLTNHFIGTQLGPKAREVERAVRARVAESLRSQFTANELNRAVELSAPVRDCSRFHVTITRNPLGGATDYAQNAITIWDDLNTFARDN